MPCSWQEPYRRSDSLLVARRAPSWASVRRLDGADLASGESHSLAGDQPHTRERASLAGRVNQTEWHMPLPAVEHSPVLFPAHRIVPESQEGRYPRPSCPGLRVSATALEHRAELRQRRGRIRLATGLRGCPNARVRRDRVGPAPRGLAGLEAPDQILNTEVDHPELATEFQEFRVLERRLGPQRTASCSACTRLHPLLPRGPLPLESQQRHAERASRHATSVTHGEGRLAAAARWTAPPVRMAQGCVAISSARPTKSLKILGRLCRDDSHRRDLSTVGLRLVVASRLSCEYRPAGSVQGKSRSSADQ